MTRGDRPPDSGSVVLQALRDPGLRKRMLRWAASHTGCPDAAEDAVQDAMYLAWRERHSFRAESAVTSWVYRILWNECARLSREKRGLAMPHTASTIVDPTGALDARLRVSGLHRRFAGHAGWRELVQVHALGWRIRDVAARQCEPVGTIKARMSRLRREIRRIA